EDGGLLARRLRERAQLLDDRLGLDLAHELADVLHLAPHGLVLREALAFEDRLEEPLRKAEARELLGGELHERLAHRLQVRHLLLAPGLADKIVVVHSRSLEPFRLPRVLPPCLTSPFLPPRCRCRAPR